MKHFSSFRLDVSERCLWRGSQRVQLAPRAFAVLLYLVSHPGRVISNVELLDAVWPNLDVQPEILKKYILEVRRALGDTPAAGRYIQNIPRLGYKFVAPVQSSEAGQADGAALSGRRAELEGLHQRYLSAATGSGGALGISGEAGIGKTALLEVFAAQSAPHCHFAQVECARQARHDPYATMLNIVETLVGCADREGLSDLAPLWRRCLSSDAQLSSMNLAQIAGPIAPLERVKRELADLIGRLMMTRPVVLVVDDIHWADDASIDFLAYLLGRFQASRLLLVAAYRVSELLRLEHPFLPLKLHFCSRGLYQEYDLKPLSFEDVETYLQRSLFGCDLARDLKDMLYAKTEGHPLFLAGLISYLMVNRHIRQVDGMWQTSQDVLELAKAVPASTQSMIELMLGTMDEAELDLLATGAMQGREFEAALVARASDRDLAQVEMALLAISERGVVIEPLGEVARAGLATLRFRFTHSLYMAALSRRLTPAKRARLAYAMAQALEWGYPERRRETVRRLAELALMAMDYRRASHCFVEAAQASAQLFASKEAMSLATAALEAIQKMPEGEEAMRLELAAQLVRGGAMTTVRGWPNPLTDEAYRRAAGLSFTLRDHAALIGSLYGQWNGLRIRGNLRGAEEVSAKLAQAVPEGDREGRLLWLHATALTNFYCGRYAAAAEHARAGIAIADESLDEGLTARLQRSPRLSLLGIHAMTSWLMGQAVQADAQDDRAFALAGESRHMASRAAAVGFSAFYHVLREDMERLEARISFFETHEDDEALSNWRPIFSILKLWVRCRAGHSEGGARAMHKALQELNEIGVRLGSVYLRYMLAEAHLLQGELHEAMAVVDEARAYASRSGEWHGMPALLLVKAHGHIALSRPHEAEQVFHEAYALAHEQGASLLCRRIRDAGRRALPALEHDSQWPAQLASLQARRRPAG